MGSQNSQANHTPLSPVNFLKRAGKFFGGRTAIVYGEKQWSYAELLTRVTSLAHALYSAGIRAGDSVAVLALNTPPMIEAHFAAPMIGAKIVPLNVRLDKSILADALRHCGAKYILCDSEFYELAVLSSNLAQIEAPICTFKDSEFGADSKGEACEYENLLNNAPSIVRIDELEDENQPISVLYTSGTTGNPKGVVYTHRGAYLAGLSNALSFGLTNNSTMLWTWPLFHSNGLSFIWAVTAVAGKHICLRSFDGHEVKRQLTKHNATHFCAAPLALNLIAETPGLTKVDSPEPVKCITGGAPPPVRVIKKLEQLGLEVIHQYGTSECYGPATASYVSPKWSHKDSDERYKLIARQGVPLPVVDDLMIANPVTMAPTPRDGKTLGEVMLRGNTVMAGYLHGQGQTDEALKNGWFHTGDMAVWHEDGSFELRDRVKDMIISGGENISSVEIEEVLYRHKDVFEAAVVGTPDGDLDEAPCAFVHCVEGAEVTSDELTDFCREHLDNKKVPKLFVFQKLPKTATGKIRKYELRETARAMAP